MKKELFDEIFIAKEDEAEEDIRLRYYLVTDAVSKGFCDLEVFGVEIDKESLAGLKSGTEIKRVKNLFLRKSEALEFLKLISRNKVTPMGLKYVIKDYIDDWIETIAVNDG